MEDKLAPKRKAHLYALLARDRLHIYSYEEAKNLIANTPYENLNGITNAEDSIETSINAIKKNILSSHHITIDKEQGKIMKPTPLVYDYLIMSALNDIHNKWIKENAKEYSKDDKLMFKHMPMALIGIEEVSKYLMIMSPIIEEIGINVGEMELKSGGKFKPNQEILKAYKMYVEDYKEFHNIKTKDDLEKNIYETITKHSALKPIDKESQARVDYMQDRIPVLCNSVINKNSDAFGNLPNLNAEL